MHKALPGFFQNSESQALDILNHSSTVLRSENSQHPINIRISFQLGSGDGDLFFGLEGALRYYMFETTKR